MPQGMTAIQIAVLAGGVLVFMSAVMLSGWAYQKARGNGGWTDVFWTFGTGLSGVACALWPAPGALPLRQALVAALVAFWSLRLGLYITRRVGGGGKEDVRYAELRAEWGDGFQRKMLGFLQIQAPVTALLCLSIILAAHNTAPALRLLDFAGFAVLVVAILGEGLADSQLKRFKAYPANRDRVCDVGLWGWSRHPNYFFEWFGWLAYPLIAIDPSRPVTWLSLIGPALMFLLLTRATGVPPLEAAMARSRGQAFRDYQDRVSAFIPLPPKRKASA